jgi:hypothetical protein
MSQQCLRSKNKNTRTITQISENEYFIEGQSDWARFGCQTDMSVITSANIDGGPFLLVGDSFLGNGRISSIQNIETDKEGHIKIKISVVK